MNSNLIDKMKLNLDNSLVNKKKTINNRVGPFIIRCWRFFFFIFWHLEEI